MKFHKINFNLLVKRQKRQTVFYGVLKIVVIIVLPTWWRWKEEGREGSGRPMAVPWPGPASTEFPHSIHTLHSWSSTFVSTIYPSYMHNCSSPPTFIGIHHLFTISTTLHWVTITNTHQHFACLTTSVQKFLLKTHILDTGKGCLCRGWQTELPAVVVLTSGMTC